MSDLKRELEPGQIVWLDKDRHNKSQVKVVRQTPRRLFTTVMSLDEESEWDVMTYRLTPQLKN